MQVSQIRIAGEPNYETRYAFIEFTTPEEVSRKILMTACGSGRFPLGVGQPGWDLIQASTALLLDGMMVFDRPIKVNMARGGSGPGIVRSNDPDRVQRTIHVGGLPFDELQEETLAEYFGHVGEVRPPLCSFLGWHVTVIAGARGVADGNAVRDLEALLFCGENNCITCTGERSEEERSLRLGGICNTSGSTACTYP